MTELIYALGMLASIVLAGGILYRLTNTADHPLTEEEQIDRAW